MSVIRVRRSTISRPTSPSSTETAPNPSTSTTDNESLPTVVGPIRRRATISERFFSPPPPNPPTAAVGSSSPTLAGAAEGEGEGEGGLIPPLPLLSPGVTRSRRSSYLPSGVGVVALSEGEGGGGGEEHGEDEVDLVSDYIILFRILRSDRNVYCGGKMMVVGCARSFDCYNDASF